jgi:hypothetical protein
VLRNILELKGNGIVNGLREGHNEELHNLYSSPNIIRINKSRGKRWAGYAACMSKKWNAYVIMVVKP